MSYEPTEILSERATSVGKDLAQNVPGGFYGRFMKRGLDILLVLAAAPFVVPVILFMALLVRRDGHAAFYWSERVGFQGRNFPMLKLRTMVHDADARLAEYLAQDAEAAAEW